MIHHIFISGILTRLHFINLKLKTSTGLILMTLV
jgi:hypothetical protein